MTADRPWGVLGTPTPDQIAEWAAGPYGAFARHVRLNGDPLWALERDAPELFAAIARTAEESGVDLEDERLRLRLCTEIANRSIPADELLRELPEIFDEAVEFVVYA